MNTAPIPLYIERPSFTVNNSTVNRADEKEAAQAEGGGAQGAALSA